MTTYVFSTVIPNCDILVYLFDNAYAGKRLLRIDVYDMILLLT